MSARADSDAESASSYPNDNSKSPRASRGSHRPSVYDAVAGRVSSDRFIRREAFIPSTRDTAASSNAPLAPDEVLFKSVRAPLLYGDRSIYDCDLHGNDQPRLPDSDLLKAIHAYGADFYSSNKEMDADVSYKSFDGSALLALGILLEESCRAALGGSGDLALVDQDDGRLGSVINEGKIGRSAAENDLRNNEGEVEGEGSDQGHRRKRMKTAK